MATDENKEGTGSAIPANVQAAINLAGDLAKASKDATISGSVILSSTDEQRTALQDYVDRCVQQGAAINAIKEANKANRPPSRQRNRTSTKTSSKK
jgi:hypothetical protein